ncbi:MAG: hypothetical protein NVS3B26_14060 [Mycobacteriales bacterium]
MTSEPLQESLVVEVFWRPGCSRCASLRRGLKKRGIPSSWRDIWTDGDARAIVRSINRGNETVPTVRIGELTLANPSAAQIEKLLLVDNQTADTPRRAGVVTTKRAASWLPTVGLIAASEVMARHGLSGPSWAADVAAVAAWWLTRPLRR